MLVPTVGDFLNIWCQNVTPNQSYSLEVRRTRERKAGKLGQVLWVSDKEESILKTVELGFAGHLQDRDHSHFKGVRTPGSRGLGLRCHHTYPLPSPVLVQELHILSLSGAWLGMVHTNASVRVCRRRFMNLGPSIIHPDLVLLCRKALIPCQVLARLVQEWRGLPQFSWQGSPHGSFGSHAPSSARGLPSPYCAF